jgi:predicted Rossmann fold flavoprotein
LVPVTVAALWTAELKGITLPDVSLRVLDHAQVLACRRGSLLFAHFGLSGPVVLDVSGVISRHATSAELHLEIDLLPEMAEEQFNELLRRESQQSGKKLLAVVLSEHLPRRLCDAVLALAGLAPDRKAAALSRAERAAITASVKRMRLPVTGTLGFEKAEVTAGGVCLDEVDSRNLQSKLTPNLYFAGEVLDLDGPIGGYNFQAAWSTGWLAGDRV